MMCLIYNKPKILFFDIETTPLQAWVWQTGQQYVSHKQLVNGHAQYGVICIAYCFNDDRSAKSIDWGYEEQDTKYIIEKFDTIIKSCDFYIGKNSDRFDVKMINAARMLNGLPGLPQWMRYTDDLEKQMRKYFRLPSQSLDYISHQLGLGGKIKMELDDWIKIVEKDEKYGRQALNDMRKYNKKDVIDTRSLWYILCEHFELKFNAAVWHDERLICKYEDCCSYDLRKDGIRISGRSKYQQYKCRSCGRYAGRTLLNKDTQIG